MGTLDVRYGQLMTAMIRAGHHFFEQGDYNLNLIGVRSRDAHSNAFNDALAVAYKINGRPVCHVFACTTDPGIYWREKPANVNGTAIVKPGQYPGLWTLGKHQGKYAALVQAENITVYRDNDGNGEINTDRNTAYTDTGLFGINCHKAGKQSRRVDKWSAGCQVLANECDFNLLMALCEKSAQLWGDRFTYTLLTEDEL
ncbi:hypothetical protein [Gilvimarinus japonicus]|uniref:Uncharacterized protein n=1 Tax=Gilvimarinus japonicus TaxID=1796469 RepID=A0ABV7HV80_9GAMM